MLDYKYVIDHLDEVIERLNTRTGDYSYLRELPKLDERRREIIVKVESLKAERNAQSKEIGKLKAQHRDEEAKAAMEKVSFDKEEIARLDVERANIDEEIHQIMLKTPNLPDASLPIGTDDSFNRPEKYWSRPTEFNFKPLSHWELGLKLGCFDFDRAAKVTGSRFTFYLGAFARLERALASLMLDTHTENGYIEVLPPFLVNTDSLTGSGQLPKFADQAYMTENTGEQFWLIPTAEVPVTNYYRNEILSIDDLPKWFCAYSSCFRAEAGAAGRDTRGIIRQHQFQKVELVKYCVPEKSFEELEQLTEEAEKILELLKLPYRRVCLSTGDLGFSSAKTYDLEVWMPSYNDYVEKDGKWVPTTENYKEISSCSNDTDYQARRMNIRFKRTKDGKTEFVHMLNGSGLAVGRTTAAVIENYQNADGTITVPEVLRKYIGCDILK
ncbi:MAG: serine--tRNA ligase [Candidatus Enterosoma sp.]|nr:serine--tRNA ligase [Bacilli bacterium]MDD6846476.1 serine--tRNA ligase [bacterium]MDY2571850.1 serine--tRNA ligase [Candidatus Enterosoma sp.]MCI6608618.1 serine--tRNA ligase [Bacilli bacterium]MDD7081560.1 serine--tRNA ligase [bacterium]